MKKTFTVLNTASYVHGEKLHDRGRIPYMEHLVVYITAPSEDEGARLAKILVEERIAACVNIVPNIRSIYRWEGKVEDDAEVLLIIKTRTEFFEKLVSRVKELHSYSVPEVIAFPIKEGLSDYLQWITDATGPETDI